MVSLSIRDCSIAVSYTHLAIGGVLDGMAAGVPVDEEFIAAGMDKRRARGDGLSTPRVEADNVQLLSGVVNGYTNVQLF